MLATKISKTTEKELHAYLFCTEALTSELFITAVISESQTRIISECFKKASRIFAFLRKPVSLHRLKGSKCRHAGGRSKLQPFNRSDIKSQDQTARSDLNRTNGKKTT